MKFILSFFACGMLYIPIVAGQAGKLDFFWDNSTECWYQDPLVSLGFNGLTLDHKDRHILIGSIKTSFGTFSYNNLLVLRFTWDGRLDETFGQMGKSAGLVDGITRSPIRAICDSANNVNVIFLSERQDGYHYVGIMRFKENGEVDEHFGKNGIMESLMPVKGVSVSDARQQKDGKFVICGFMSDGQGRPMVLRVHSTGLLDSSFGKNGVFINEATQDHEAARGLEIQKDGKIVVAGGKQLSGYFKGYFLLRINPTGDIDSSYGHFGRVDVPMGTYGWEIPHMAMDSSDRVVLVGEIDQKTNIFCYKTDGKPDSAFNKTGVLKVKVAIVKDNPYCVGIQSDQKIVVAGGLEAFNGTTASMLRLTSKGNFDLSFFGTGIANNLTPVFKSISIRSVVFRNNRIVTSGIAGNSAYLQHYFVDSEPILQKVEKQDPILFPNPISAQSELVYYLEKETLVTVRVLDKAGRLVYHVINNYKSVQGRHTLPLRFPEEFGHGVYVIQFVSDEHLKSIQFVK